jgi:pimeloyl-ACP methyl ester carboxylesterase
MTAPGMQRPPQPMNWQVNKLQLAGLSWGEPGDRPLLALHGWLDNAASFAFLAPRLTSHHVVALDLTGHGKSARRSADASYQIWDDLPEILGVMDALGWESCDLIGHSRGAIISTLIACAFPERVGRLVMLDAVAPDAVPAQNFPLQLRKALQDKMLLQSRSDRVFATIEDAVASRAARGLPALAAATLVERNLCDCAEGVQWITDPRLRGASAMKMTAEHIQSVLNALTMPTLLLLGQDSLGRSPETAQYAQRHIAHLTVQVLTGGHHFHMEAGVADVAQAILQFLSAEDVSNSNEI